jgi:hypothetical protein
MGGREDAPPWLTQPERWRGGWHPGQACGPTNVLRNNVRITSVSVSRASPAAPWLRGRRSDICRRACGDMYVQQTPTEDTSTRASEFDVVFVQQSEQPGEPSRSRIMRERCKQTHTHTRTTKQTQTHMCVSPRTSPWSTSQTQQHTQLFAARERTRPSRRRCAGSPLPGSQRVRSISREPSRCQWLWSRQQAPAPVAQHITQRASVAPACEPPGRLAC